MDSEDSEDRFWNFWGYLPRNKKVYPLEKEVGGRSFITSPSFENFQLIRVSDCGIIVRFLSC